jgi:hypothetical protein
MIVLLVGRRYCNRRRQDFFPLPIEYRKRQRKRPDYLIGATQYRQQAIIIDLGAMPYESFVAWRTTQFVTFLMYISNC